MSSELNSNQLVEGLIESMKYLDGLGLMPSLTGNASLRLSEDTILITPSGVRKSELIPSKMVKLKLDGSVVGGGKPSSEYRLHLQVYRKLPQVNVIIHCHPLYSLILANLGITVDVNLYPEGIECFKISSGESSHISIIGPIEAGTWELAEAVTEQFESGARIVLIRKHGLVIWDEEDPMRCAYRVEVYERLANITYHELILRANLNL